MLAYLWQEHPELVDACLRAIQVAPFEAQCTVHTQSTIHQGFLDLTLSHPGERLVIIESKLGSKTSLDQVTKYVEHARSVRAREGKALVLLTRDYEDWPPGAYEIAEEDVVLVRARWQAIANAARASGLALGRDFADMLAREGIVTPNPLAAEDFDEWAAGQEVGRRIDALLTELRDPMTRIGPRLRSAGSVIHSNLGSIYRSFEFGEYAAGLGFWPARDSRNVYLFAYVFNRTLPREHQKSEARRAVEDDPERVLSLSWNEWPTLNRKAVDVLTASDFGTQVEQLASFVTEAIDLFTGNGYLPRGEPASSATRRTLADERDA